MIRSPHATALPEHEQWGNTISGSRWFKGDPIVRDSVWRCPIDDGAMVYTGWQWPMYPPGLHHCCETCGFTAALSSRDMLKHGIAADTELPE